MIGSIERVAVEMDVGDKTFFAMILELCDAAKALFGTRALSEINDRRDHGAVCAILKQAIAQSSSGDTASAKASKWHGKQEYLCAALAIFPGHARGDA